LVLRTLQLLYTVDSPSCTLSSRAYPTRSEAIACPEFTPLLLLVATRRSSSVIIVGHCGLWVVSCQSSADISGGQPSVVVGRRRLSSVIVGRCGLWVSRWLWSSDMVSSRSWSVIAGLVIMGCQSSVIGRSSAVVFGHGQQLVVNRQSSSVVINHRSSVMVVVGCAVVVVRRSSSVIISHQLWSSVVVIDISCLLWSLVVVGWLVGWLVGWSSSIICHLSSVVVAVSRCQSLSGGG